MSAHPTTMRLQQLTDAFNRGDLDAMMDLFAPDAVWHSGGHNPASGTFRGRSEARRFFEQMRDANLAIEPVDILGNDDYLVFFLRVRAERDGKTIDQTHANAWKVGPDGFTEGWFLPADQSAWDAYLS